MYSRLTTVIVAGMFRGIVVLVTLAATIAEGLTDIGLIVIMPTFKVALTGSLFQGLFTDGYITQNYRIENVLIESTKYLRKLSLAEHKDSHSSRVSKRLVVPKQPP